MLVTALVFLLILSALVLIHEAGHFFVAKKLGIKVEEFGFGLPLLPAIWSIKRGETMYSIYPALIGGFVKLYGEDEAGAGRVRVTKDEEQKIKNNKEDEHRAFYSRPVGQRASIVIAGVIMNTLLAIAIFYAFMLMTNFKTILPVYPPGLTVPKLLLVDQIVTTQVIIGEVSKNSPAEKAGIKRCSQSECSQVISINGVKIENNKQFIKIVNENKGKEITLVLKDLIKNKTKQVDIVPRLNPPKKQGVVGVEIAESGTIHLDYRSPIQKLLSGISHPINMMYYQFVVLGKLIEYSLQSGNVNALSEGVSGPVGIFNVVGQVVDIPDLKDRVIQLLNLAGLLSISLAFFNVLPIPGLDGGRLFFILAEGIFGLKIKPKVEGYINAAGMAFLIGLILLITYKDIMQLFTK